MYNDNPTLRDLHSKTVDEAAQGQVYGVVALEAARPGKHFYIESYGCQDELQRFGDRRVHSR